MSIKYEPYALPQTGRAYTSSYPASSSTKMDTPPSLRSHEDSGHTHQQSQGISVVGRGTSDDYSYSPKDEYV